MKRMKERRHEMVEEVEVEVERPRLEDFSVVCRQAVQ